MQFGQIKKKKKKRASTLQSWETKTFAELRERKLSVREGQEAHKVTQQL